MRVGMVIAIRCSAVVQAAMHEPQVGGVGIQRRPIPAAQAQAWPGPQWTRLGTSDSCGEGTSEGRSCHAGSQRGTMHPGSQGD